MFLFAAEQIARIPLCLHIDQPFEVRAVGLLDPLRSLFLVRKLTYVPAVACASMSLNASLVHAICASSSEPLSQAAAMFIT